MRTGSLTVKTALPQVADIDVRVREDINHAISW